MAKSPGQELDDLIAEMRATAIQRIRTVEQEQLELRWAETLERLRLPDVSMSPVQELERLINKIYALADRLRAPSRATPEEQSPAVKKAMERFWRRCAEVDIEAIIQAVAELPDRTSPDDWPEAMLVTADELRAILSASRATSAPEEPQQAVNLSIEDMRNAHAREKP